MMAATLAILAFRLILAVAHDLRENEFVVWVDWMVYPVAGPDMIAAIMNLTWVMIANRGYDRLACLLNDRENYRTETSWAASPHPARSTAALFPPTQPTCRHLPHPQ